MSMDNSNKVKIGIDILFFIVIHFFLKKFGRKDIIRIGLLGWTVNSTTGEIIDN